MLALIRFWWRWQLGGCLNYADKRPPCAPYTQGALWIRIPWLDGSNDMLIGRPGSLSCLKIIKGSQNLKRPTITAYFIPFQLVNTTEEGEFRQFFAQLNNILCQWCLTVSKVYFMHFVVYIEVKKKSFVNTVCYIKFLE